MNDDTGGNDGNSRVFEYTDNSWTQVGSNIIPNTSDNDPVYFGNTVRISGNGKFFAVSGYQSKNPAGEQQSGETRVYIRQGNTFTQIINTIYGQTQDFFGSQIFLNTDGTILAVGSGGFNGTDLHPMKLYQMTHNYNASPSTFSIWGKWKDLLSSQTLFEFYNNNSQDTNYFKLKSSEGTAGVFNRINLDVFGLSTLNTTIKNTDLIQEKNKIHHMALLVLIQSFILMEI